MAVTDVTDASFEGDVLQSGKPVVVDFWAEWCGPCKQIAPTLEEIGTEMEGSVEIAKINIDENQQAPMKYGVRGIPTLMMFKDGELVSQLVGAHPKTTIKGWIDENS